MRTRLVCAAAAIAVLLVGCAGQPAPTPTRSDPGIGVCDAVLYTGTIDVDLVGASRPLGAEGFPIAQLRASGIEPTCTARLTVDADPRELDVALYDVPVDDLAMRLDDLATAEGWTLDGDAPRWRDGGDPARVLEAIEIEEGVLVVSWSES